MTFKRPPTSPEIKAQANEWMDKMYEYDRKHPLAGTPPDPPNLTPHHPEVDPEQAAKNMALLPPSVRRHLEQ